MGFGGFMRVFALDQNFFNIRGIMITDGAFNQIAFFMDQSRRGAIHGQAADIIPLPHQIGKITGDFSLGAF